MEEQEQILLEAQEQTQTVNRQNSSSASTNVSGGNGSNYGNGGNNGGGNAGGNTDPNYQGEKKGFVYLPSIGYVPTTPTGDDVGPDHRNEWATTEEELSGNKIGSI